MVYLNKPRVASSERYKVLTFQKNEQLGSIFSIQVYYGYMQTPNIREVLEDLKNQGKIKIPAEPARWLILISVERFVSKVRGLFNRLRWAIFRGIFKFTKPAINYFGLGSDPQVAIETINI